MTEALMPDPVVQMDRPKQKAEQLLQTSQVIWDAILEMYSQQQTITRGRLAQITGYKLALVDDHTSRMVDNGKLRRVASGVFEPELEMPEPRAVTVTHLQNGLSKIEIGDVCLELWPRERRLLASLLVGDAVQYSNIQAGHDANFVMTTIYEELKKLKRDLAG